VSDDRTQQMPTLEKTPPSAEQGGGGGGHLEQAASAAAYDPGGSGGAGHRAGRFWSLRRVPAGIVALLAAALAGVLLYDVAAVRAGEPAMGWRRTLADELAGTAVNDAKVLAAACAVTLLGVWLITLAVTPGRRGLLPMRREHPHVRAGLERSAAGLVLRDRAMQVTGVQSVDVSVGRRKVRAHARAHFRDLHEVRGDLDSVLAEGIRQLGLARQPGLSVHVRRPKRG
jgi:hypothetical protein